MDKEPVIVVKSIRDKVVIEDRFSYSANLTLGLDEGNDFYLELEFIEIELEDYEQLAKLAMINKALKFYSSYIKKEEYNITHIIITGFETNNKYQMKWTCLSDNPSLYDLTITD